MASRLLDKTHSSQALDSFTLQTHSHLNPFLLVTRGGDHGPMATAWSGGFCVTDQGKPRDSLATQQACSSVWLGCPLFCVGWPCVLQRYHTRWWIGCLCHINELNSTFASQTPLILCHADCREAISGLPLQISTLVFLHGYHR